MQDDLYLKGTITEKNTASYVVGQINVDSHLERQLRAETRSLPNGGMISSSDVGALLALLALSVNTRKAIEVGTFTGYTALKIAGALPRDGKLICCDINEEWTSIGRKFWRQSQLEEKIDLRIAPALATLGALLATGEEATFDFVFIDADKTGYDSYYEACLKLLRPGGLVVLDNMLWSGAVADLSIQDQTTIAIRTLNKKISEDPRVDACLLTVGDGLMLARKK